MFAKKLDRRLVSLTAPTSLEAEQYQALRLKLESLQRSRGVRVMAITSPGVKDGKSVTAINLAAALAQGSDARVLLIEADLRRPAVARYLRLGAEAGAGPGRHRRRPESTAARRDRQTRGRTGSTSCSRARPSRRFTSSCDRRGSRTLLQEAREQYDYVLLDTPPLGPVSDCALLARWIDGVLLVVAAHRTSRKLLEGTLNLLEGASVLGIVFNGDDRPIPEIPPALLSRLLFTGHTGPPNRVTNAAGL